MSFIKYVCSFTLAFILAFFLTVFIFLYFRPNPPELPPHDPCLEELVYSSVKTASQPAERSSEELYTEYMELSPVERTGKKDLLSKAAHGGHLPAIRQMATEAEEGGVPEDMIEKEYGFWMKKAADMGDPDGQYETFFLHGISNTERLAYLSRAAEQNYGWALLKLGRLYAEGNETYSIARNEKKAIECYRRAAKANNQDALYLMYLLARLHVLPEVEIAQLNERYREEAKQAEDGISPSFSYPEDLEKSDHGLRLLKTYLPANDKVKPLRNPDRSTDPFGEND